MKQLRITLIILAQLAITFTLFACGSSVEPIPTMVPLPVDRTEVPRISAEELKMRLDKGDEILIIDTRSSGTYNFRHIPGATMEPESFDAIARDQQIITYCSWPNERDSASLALKLYEDGFTNVSALLGGMNAWVQADYPVAGSDAED